VQELRRTQEMILRERKRVEETGKEATARGERPDADRRGCEKRDPDKIDRMLPSLELKPLNPEPINLKMNSQPVKVLFETVGKLPASTWCGTRSISRLKRNSLFGGAR